MRIDSKNKLIFDMARKYLLSFENVDDDMLDKHLNHWERQKPNSINDLLYGMLNSIRNK